MRLATLAITAIAVVQILIPAVSGKEYSAIQLLDFIDELTEKYPFLTNNVQESDQVARDVQEFTRDVEDFVSAYREMNLLQPRGDRDTTITTTVLCIPQDALDHTTTFGPMSAHSKWVITCPQVDISKTFRELHKCPTYKLTLERCLRADKTLFSADYYVEGHFHDKKGVDDNMWESGVRSNSHIMVWLYHPIKPVSDREMEALFQKYIQLDH